MSNQDSHEECPLCEREIVKALHEHLPKCDLTNSRVQ